MRINLPDISGLANSLESIIALLLLLLVTWGLGVTVYNQIRSPRTMAIDWHLIAAIAGLLWVLK